MSEQMEEKIKAYRTAPFDARFPNTNQTRNCFQNYLGKLHDVTLTVPFCLTTGNGILWVIPNFSFTVKNNRFFGFFLRFPLC